MLMRSQDYVNYNAVLPEHEAVHERLKNWSRWLGCGRAIWTAHPMWRHLKEKEERERGSASPREVHVEDAHIVERAVACLPEKYRFAIRWWYVFSGNPALAARQIAVTKQRLAELVRDGRSILNNQLNCAARKIMITSAYR